MEMTTGSSVVNQMLLEALQSVALSTKAFQSETLSRRAALHQHHVRTIIMYWRGLRQHREYHTRLIYDAAWSKICCFVERVLPGLLQQSLALGGNHATHSKKSPDSTCEILPPRSRTGGSRRAAALLVATYHHF